MSNAAPARLGSYHLVKLVHTGHACQIWQADDAALGRTVGIKVVLDRFANDREQIAYLRKEFLVGSDAIHPHLIEVYAFESQDGVPYLVMEWFPAPSMKRRIQAGVELAPPLLSKIIVQAAEALAYLHCRGWVHRDIKPDNFLVADNGTVKLIDFSLAVRRKRGLGRLLAKCFGPKSKIQGTRSYMAPEQIRGEVVDERTDLYSFACAVFELLSGRLPFTGVDTNELLTKHLKATPPPLATMSAMVTPELSQLIQRSMAKDPAERPKSVGDFVREFRMMKPFHANHRVK